MSPKCKTRVCLGRLVFLENLERTTPVTDTDSARDDAAFRAGRTVVVPSMGRGFSQAFLPLTATIWACQHLTAIRT